MCQFRADDGGEGHSTELSVGFCGGRVSIGFIHATPGDMKSFRSSAERIALILSCLWSRWRQKYAGGGDATTLRD